MDTKLRKSVMKATEMSAVPEKFHVTFGTAGTLYF